MGTGRMTKLSKLFLAALGLGLVAAMVSLWLADRTVRQRFEGVRWELPSLVYARPLELYVGAVLEPTWLEKELAATGYRRLPQPEGPGTYSRQQGRFHIYRRSFPFDDGLEPERLIEFDLKQGRVVALRSSGQNLPLVRLEPLQIGGIYPTRFEDRKLIRLDEVPEFLIDVLLVTEDQEFYQHFGVAPRSILRAIWANVKAGAYVQGASTITQQLVKNFYLSSERSLRRKFVEGIYAILVELRYEKNQILEAYLNEVFLAQQGDRAIHGFGLGSQYYFNRGVSQLTLEQSALLVAIINGPSVYNPFRFPERAKQRRNQILKKMLDASKISEDQYQQAVQQPLRLSRQARPEWNRYPAYLDLVKRHLLRDYNYEDLMVEGLRIYTSFDPHTEWQARDSLQQALRSMGSAAKGVEAAVVVGNLTGDVEAVIGSRQFEFAGFNRVLDARRSIGSLIKPLVLITALEQDHGQQFQLTSRLDDSEIVVPLAAGKSWSPKNFDRKSHGEVALYEALAHSYNQAFVRLGMQLGPEQVAERVRRLARVEESLVPSNPAMLLGAFGLSPMQVLSLYQPLATGGFHRPLRTVRVVRNHEGELLSATAPEVEAVLDPGVAHLAQYAMQTVMKEGTGQLAYQMLSPDILAAGKTGTTDDRRDSWFAGYTGDKIAVVWLGRDDHQPTTLTGSSGALAVWARLMAKISRRSIRLHTPEGVSYHWVDREQGLASFEFCQDVRLVPFLEGTEPLQQAECIKTLQPIVDWIKKLFE